MEANINMSYDRMKTNGDRPETVHHRLMHIIQYTGDVAMRAANINPYKVASNEDETCSICSSSCRTYTVMTWKGNCLSKYNIFCYCFARVISS